MDILTIAAFLGGVLVGGCAWSIVHLHIHRSSKTKTKEMD